MCLGFLDIQLIHNLCVNSDILMLQFLFWLACVFSVGIFFLCNVLQIKWVGVFTRLVVVLCVHCLEEIRFCDTVVRKSLF